MPESRALAPVVGFGWWDGLAQVMHQHRDAQLIYPASGVLAVTTALGTWVAAAHQVAWTPAGHDHSHRAPVRTEVAALMLPEALCAELPKRPAVFRVSPLMREAMLVLARGRISRPEALGRLQAVVVDELTGAPEETMYLPEPRDDRLRTVTGLLREDLSDNRTLAELGRFAGASARTLSRLFQVELGMGFHDWRTQLRVQHALVFLWQGQSVAQTAASCGWSNPSSFVDAFKAIVGVTPGRYRTDQERSTSLSSWPGSP